MRKALPVGVLAWLLAIAAGAAEIYGTVSEGGKTLPQGVPVKLDCSGTTGSGQTDQYGSYSVKLAATGECVLSIDYKGSKPSAKVTLYEKPTKFDAVVKEDSGKLVLARK